MRAYVEPLRSDMWFKRVEIISSGQLTGVESALRHAAHLLQMTPQALRPQVGLAVSEDEFEALLSAGDFDAAARQLIARPTALSVCTDLDEERVEAKIGCVFLGRVISGNGDNAATAILDAWTTCLLALRTQFGDGLLGLTHAHLSLEQSAQH